MRIHLHIALVFVLFSSCKSKNTTQDSNAIQDSKKFAATINWMGHWKDREGKEQLVKQIAREFELINQDIKVNMLFPQEIYKTENYRPQIVDSVVQMIHSNHFTWDIVYLDVSNYSSVANKLKDQGWAKKHLVNFEEFEWFRNSHKPFIFSEPQYKRSTGDQIIGPVIEGYYVGLWFNKKVAEKLGLSIKTTGMTFDDLKGYLKAAFEYNKTAEKKITIFNSEGQDNTNFILTSLVQSELGIVDSTTVDINKGKKALLRGLKAMEELSVFSPLSVLHEKGAKDVTLLDEKNLFTIFQSYGYNRWAKIDKNKTNYLIPAELPIFEKPGMFYPGVYQSVWAVFKNSPNKDNAIKLMQYICSNDIAQQWLNLTKNPTGLKTRISSSDLAQDQVDKFNAEIDRKYGKNIMNTNLAELLFGSKNKGIGISANPVINGEVSADEYYNSVVKKIIR